MEVKQITAQLTLKKHIGNFVINTQKAGKANLTESYIQTRIDLLKEYWEKFRTNHDRMVDVATSKDFEEDYFRNETFDLVELLYCENLGLLKETLRDLQPISSYNTAFSSSAQANIPPVPSIANSLPKINLTSFGGDFREWSAFHDLFKSLIDCRGDLTGSQKLYYLKTSLHGQAEQLLRNTAITDANYSSAWKILCDRYQNTRILVSSYLKMLSSLAAMKTESADELKRLYDGTTEAVKALECLNRPVNCWDDWLIFITAQKLDSITRKDWESSISSSTEPSTFEIFSRFLQNRIHTLEAVGLPNMKRKEDHRSSSASNIQSKVPVVRAYVTSWPSKCPNCNGKHILLFCPSFKQKTTIERRNFVSKEHLCFNCLKTEHIAANCPSTNRCKLCQQSHHSMLHLSQDTFPETKAYSSAITPISTNVAVRSLSAAALSVNMSNTILLATAKVILKSPEGRSLHVTALLDQGAQRTFIAASAANCLRLKRTKVNIPISGIGGCDAALVESMVTVRIQSQIDQDFHLDSNALVLPKLTRFATPHKLHISSFPHLKGLALADPDFAKPSSIELIIGADIYYALLRDGLRHGLPTAQNTTLGWILSGPAGAKVSNTSSHINVHTSTTLPDLLELDHLIRKFWEIEEIAASPMPLSEEDQHCEQFYQETTKRDSNGRYIVCLPIKSQFRRPLTFGDSRSNAVNCLMSIEKRFLLDPVLQSRYVEFMEEYHTLNHMELARATSRNDDHKLLFYFPHHGVLRENSVSTKLRVVFNGSRKSRGGPCLNEYLAVGPTLQNDLRSVILRWRKHPIVFSADIKMMYRQIRVHDQDTNLQRIVWRKSSLDPLQDFRLCTVTYGTSSAPYLAIRTLLQLSEDEKQRFPLGSEVLRSDFYVDDVLSGAENVTSALQLQNQLINILKSGGFELHKWSSNCSSLLQAVNFQSCSSVDLSNDTTIKTLGMLWDHTEDCFKFQVCLQDPPTTVTKRNILSDVAKLYDPLGFLSPSILQAKCKFQELWFEKSLEWDTPVPDQIARDWLLLREELPRLENITVPRWIGCNSNNLSYEIHAFSDASEKAYAAVAYLRVCHDYANIQMFFLCSKTKLAPIKQLSIPRLELCGAHLMARLVKNLQTSLKFSDIPVHCWSDAQIVITWLKSHPSKWKTFIANRCSQIQELLPSAHWRHIPGSCNPADCASRGLSPSDLIKHDLWWQGPGFLKLPSIYWPDSKPLCSIEKTDLEERSSNVSVSAAVEVPISWALIDRVSCLRRLMRITAYFNRFICNTRKRSSDRNLGSLTASELEDALIFCIRDTQQANYPSEYRRLSSGNSVKSTSRLIRLSPFFDHSTKTIRVGGRLQNSNLTADAKHPFILSKNCRLSDLIISETHKNTLHGGIGLTLNTIRQRFWILSCRDKVRRYIQRCLICFRQRVSARTQLMGILPSDRVTATRPFLNTGIDYAGPILIRFGPGRGRTAHKAYIAIFVCLATKAIHIELVSDQTTSAFLAAYKRFTARRGFCNKVYSDNAKNFVGADRELQKSLFLLKAQLPEELLSLLAFQRTTWIFIPPNAPNFGGLWEAGVKAAKHHLKRVIGSATLTFEEMYTLLTQIEACLNSRPLCPISSDPKDEEALTPGHFLMGSAPLTLPEQSTQGISMNRLARWQMIQQMYENFWKRWSLEYLNNLQVRTKWTTTTPNVEIGSIVLLRDNNLPPSQWALGRIVQTHPGIDGLVRVVSIKCKDTIIKRPITKICPLPSHDSV